MSGSYHPWSKDDIAYTCVIWLILLIRLSVRARHELVDAWGTPTLAERHDEPGLSGSRSRGGEADHLDVKY